MNRWHYALATAGTAGFVVTQSAVIEAVNGLVPIETLVEVGGNDYLVVAVLAGIALALSLPVLASGRASNLDQADVPEPERPTTGPRPGDGFDEEIEAVRTALPISGRDRRVAVHGRLRDAAEETVMRIDGLDRGRATAQIGSGEWTDDRRAAALLRRSNPPNPAPLDPLRALLGAEPRFAMDARRCADAIAARAGHAPTAMDDRIDRLTALGGKGASDTGPLPRHGETPRVDGGYRHSEIAPREGRS